MRKFYFNLLIVLYFFSTSQVLADINAANDDVKPSQIELIRNALDEFSHSHTKNSVVYDQKKREMLFYLIYHKFHKLIHSYQAFSHMQA